MELSAATLLPVALASLAILVSVLRRSKSASSSDKRRPPGPPCLPFIGSRLHLLTSKAPVVLRDLARKYGPVMYLRLGQVDHVVISSPAAAQEVLRDNNLNFSSRPNLLVTETICYGGLDIAFAPYGAYWRTLRKLCTMELLSARKAAFGEVCDAELREQFLTAMEVGVSAGGGFCVSDLFPSLWFVDVITGLKGGLWKARRQIDAVFDTIIAECEARREKKKTSTTATAEEDDILSVILQIKDEGEIKFPVGNTNVKAIILDLFIGGTETTATSVEWIMSELMRNPDVMQKVQAEVRRTFDNKKPQDHEAHIEEPRYMKMIIKETLRMHPPLPLMIPHVCRQTCDIGGFKVLEGSRILINAWAIGRNPDSWEDAEVFRPERFEDSKLDYKGTQYEYSVREREEDVPWQQLWAGCA
ncbi:hypothetical protein ACQ4PT_044420 [Festuca glaucescens]